jgi:hypothetical protein
MEKSCVVLRLAHLLVPKTASTLEATGNGTGQFPKTMLLEWSQVQVLHLHQACLLLPRLLEGSHVGRCLIAAI